MTEPDKRRHVYTGRRKGAPKGNGHALRTGMKSSAFFAERKRIADLMRVTRAALQEAAPLR